MEYKVNMHRSTNDKNGSHSISTIAELNDQCEALVALRFQSNIPQETVDYLLAQIRKPVSHGGAGLNISLQSDSSCDDVSGYVYLISASDKVFMKAAERFKLVKRTVDGSLEEFSAAENDQFVCLQDGSKTTLFSVSDKNFLIQKLLNEIRAEKTESLPGLGNRKILKDHPIVPNCVANGIIQTLFPLHATDELKRLKRNWYMNFKNWDIPIDEIKAYFGDTIALYFAFLGFYSKFLIPPCVIALVHRMFFDDQKLEENAWFAVLNLIWATLFLEIWKRKCAELSFMWGTFKKDKDEFLLLEEPRAEYHGQIRTSPITEVPEIYYPTWKRRAKMYCVTYPCLLLSILVAIMGMLFYFELQHEIARRFEDTPGFLAAILRRTPGIIYASIIALFNNFYSKVATRLNDWENHRHESSYNNHIILKLVLFHFVNSFLSLFYIAFYLQDMELLRQHLATLLITQQIIQQIQESLIPYLMYKRHCVKITKKGKKILLKHQVESTQVFKESNLPEYKDTYGDYLELFLQFGYVFLFSAAYPLAAFWALVNNIVEIRSDAFKLCKLFQRPFPQSASSIGAWQVAFELMSITAVITNSALIAMSQSTRNWIGGIGPVRYVLLFVALEHAIIAFKAFLANVIPDTPGWITKELAKSEYHTRQVLKFQRRRYGSSTSSETGTSTVNNVETTIH